MFYLDYCTVTIEFYTIELGALIHGSIKTNEIGLPCRRLQMIIKGGINKILVAIGAGLSYVATAHLVNHFSTQNYPLWPYLEHLAYLSPLWALLTEQLIGLVGTTIVLSVSVLIAHHISVRFSRYAALLINLIFACILSLSLNNYLLFNSLNNWLATSAACAVILYCWYIFFFYANYAALPLVVATYLVSNMVQQLIFASYPHAILFNAIVVLVIIMSSGAWFFFNDKRTSA